MARHARCDAHTKGRTADDATPDRVRTETNPCYLSPLIGIPIINAIWGRRKPKPAAPGKFVSVGAHRIHYQERPGNGVPILCLHGMPGTHLDFEHVMTHLDGAHVIAIDRPGYGWSEGGPLDYQEQIDLVPEFLKALGFTRAILVGHSFGGLLALGVACMHPDITAALALIAPSGGGLRSGPFRLAAARMVQVMQLPGARQVIEATAGGIIRRTSAEIDFRFAFRPDPGDPGYRARLSQVTLHDDNLRAMANDRLRYTKNIEWIDKQVPTIDVPSVTLLAVADRPIPIKHGRRLAAALCGTHVIELPGGHMIPYTKPAVVAKAIMQAAELAVSEPDTNPLSPNHRTDLPKEPSIKHFEKPYRSRLCARSARVRPEISPGRHRFGSP